MRKVLRLGLKVFFQRILRILRQFFVLTFLKQDTKDYLKIYLL